MNRPGAGGGGEQFRPGDNNRPGRPGGDNGDRPGRPGDNDRPFRPGDNTRPGQGGGGEQNRPGRPGDNDNRPGRPGDNDRPFRPGDNNRPSRPVKAAVANDGIARIGRSTPTIIAPIASPIAIVGTTGETTIASSFTTTGTINGTTTTGTAAIGGTTIGGDTITGTARTIPISITGVGPPGPRSRVGSATVGSSPCTTTMAITCTTIPARSTTAINQ